MIHLSAAFTTADLDTQKLNVRHHKFEALPVDSSWKNPKYKTVLIYPLMSDDENEKGPDGKPTGSFLSHPLAWRSETVSVKQ